MKREKKFRRYSILRLVMVLAALVVLNVVFSNFFLRFDLTKEKRYSISDATHQLLEGLDDVVYIRIFLEGELPADYRKFRNEIQDLLDEYRTYSGRMIEYDFIDPFDQPSVEETNAYVRALMEDGLEVRQINVQSLEEFTQKKIIPGAIISYKGREIAVNLLPEQKSMVENTGDIVAAGISTLEYTLSNTIQKLEYPEPQKIAFLQGHGELAPRHLADLAISLQKEQFEVEFLDLTQNLKVPASTDLLIIAQPTQYVNEQEKFKIDQYIMAGGKVLWVLDKMNASLDSLYGSGQGAYLATDYDLNLEDQLFNYGVRINADLVQDLQSAKIPLFAGNTSQPTFYPWTFFPIIFPEGGHPVVKHLEPVIIKFASSIDTVQVPDVHKTVLLSTSDQSRIMMNPVALRLSEAGVKPNPQQYNRGNIPVAVLLEGQFNSIFRNRLTQQSINVFKDSLGINFREQGEPTKMIVISDGDMVKNEFRQDGYPQPLGFYRFNPNYIYANKEFIMNSVDYLLDNYGLIATRTKEFKIRPLDQQKVRDEQLKWQLINLAIPLAVIILFGLAYTFIRRKKYTS